MTCNDRIIGKHVFGNLYGCPKELLANEVFLKNVVLEAARVANTKIYDLKSWKIEGPKGGISVIALVIESHIAIHTWIEYEYATVDIYTCGEHSDPEAAFNYIISMLKPRRYVKYKADRSQQL